MYPCCHIKFLMEVMYADRKGGWPNALFLLESQEF